MIPAGHHIWRLSEGGDHNFGLSCTEEGLFLGRTPLVERRDGAYTVRSGSDLQRLLSRTYGADIKVDRVMPGLTAVASALSANNLCLAQIAAVHLRLPDLPDEVTRAVLEAEDLLTKQVGDRLARAAWDDAEHPRTGTPPNPGWFAPKDGSGQRVQPTQVAQRGREEREPEEILDPMAPVRQAVWDARIAILRRIDPDNPNLTYFANPGSPPDREALDRLDAAIEAASIKRVTDKVMPGGVPIGTPGRGYNVRELREGTKAAGELFDYLSVGGTVYRSESNLTIIKLPGKSSFVTYRPVSTSGPPAIDINIPGIRFMRLHFVGD